MLNGELGVPKGLQRDEVKQQRTIHSALDPNQAYEQNGFPGAGFGVGADVAQIDAAKIPNPGIANPGNPGGVNPYPSVKGKNAYVSGEKRPGEPSSDLYDAGGKSGGQIQPMVAERIGKSNSVNTSMASPAGPAIKVSKNAKGELVPSSEEDEFNAKKYQEASGTGN